MPGVAAGRRRNWAVFSRSEVALRRRVGRRRLSRAFLSSYFADVILTASVADVLQSGAGRAGEILE